MSQVATTWFRLADGFLVQKQVDRRRVVERWGTETLPETGAVTTAEVEALLESVPVGIGDAYPDPQMPGCPCVDKRLVFGPRSGRAVVEVVYDSRVRFRLGPLGTRSRSGSSTLVPLSVPVVEAGRLTWVRFGERGRTTRRVTMVTAGLDVDLVTQTVALNVGCWYFFSTTSPAAIPDFSVDGDDPPPSGLLCQLSDHEVRGLGTGEIVMTYEFRSSGPVLEIPGGVIGSDVDLPALDQGDEYVVKPAGSTWSVGRVRLNRRVPRGLPLPTGNIFNPLGVP